MAIFRSASKSCPIQVGVIAPWWLVPNPEIYGQKVNLFGKWSQDGKPASGTKKVKMIPLADLLVWPVNMETNDAGEPIRIPFTAFHYLRSRHDMDLSQYQYTFSTRGKKFFNEVAKITARVVRVSQMS